MAKKIFEVAFEINGELANNFSNTFTTASAKMDRLKLDIQDIGYAYRKGKIDAATFEAKHKELTAEMMKESRAIDTARRALERLNDQQHRASLLSRAGSYLGGKATALSNATTGFAANSVRNALTMGAAGGAIAIGAGGYILGSSLNKAMEYEAQLASIQALTGITNTELAKMDALALKMGADTKYSALQAAQGIEELLKAGMSPATVQAGGLEAALSLATAGGLELSEAAVTMSDALNGFKKDGMTSADAANILAGAANASSTDVRKLAEGLSQIGPVADGIGVSFRGVNATLAAFSNNMLKGSDAGTSLKTFLANVQPQTKEATALFQKYGLAAANGANNIFFANGRLKDMAEVAGILQKKFKDLNDQQRSDVFYDLFGSDAVRAANVLYKEGAEGIQKMYKEMADVTAYDVAKKKMDTAAGSVEQFRGAIETLQIRALRPTLPLIKKLFDGAGDVVEQLTPRVEKAVDRAQQYFRTRFYDNPEFRKLPNLESKIKFVFDDFKRIFDSWYAGGGNKQIKDATSGLIGFISDALSGSSEQLTEIGAKLGGSVASGMLSGLKEFAQKNPEMAALMAFIATPGPVQVKAAAAMAVVGGATASNTLEAIDAKKQAQENASNDAWQKLQNSTPDNLYMKDTVLRGGENRPFYKNWWDSVRNFAIDRGLMDPPSPDGSNFSGLRYVPFDGYISELHRGERVLTATESKEYNAWQRLGGRSSGGVGDTYNVTFAPVINGMNKEEVLPELQQQQQSFLEQFQQMAHQQRRVAYGQ